MNALEHHATSGLAAACPDAGADRSWLEELMSLAASPFHRPSIFVGVMRPARWRAESARRAGVSVQVAARTLGVLALGITVLALVLLEYPAVLGRWEGFGTFQVMAGAEPPLSFEITPGGFTYDFNKGRFALVDLSYYTAEWLGWSLAAFRLPALLAGALSVGLFFVIAGRAFGFWPGLVSALALALNPMVVLFWHQVIVSTVTLVCLLLVIERYQHLERAHARPGTLLWALATFTCCRRCCCRSSCSGWASAWPARAGRQVPG
jgi:hypothetical protein